VELCPDERACFQSDEDKQLKDDLEMLVERLHVSVALCREPEDERAQLRYDLLVRRAGSQHGIARTSFGGHPYPYSYGN
jgi:hypothetical protein